MLQSKDRTKSFIGRYAHFWIGLGLVALLQEQMALGWALGLSMVAAFAWEVGAALVARYWYTFMVYRPERADGWSPSVGDIIPWVLGALAAGSYWLWAALPPARP